MATDDELLDRWCAGDKTAGEELFDRHFASIFRFFASKLPDAAHDLTQETLLACVESRERLAAASSFRAYLFGIARNRLLMTMRGRYRKPAHVPISELSVADIAPSPSSMLTANERQAVLLAAMRRLPADVQMTLELYYWEELSTKEIAEATDVAEGTVRSRLARAREELGDHFVESDLADLSRRLCT